MDGGAWWAAVHEVAKSQTQLSDSTFTFHFHALEKEMATHSSVLAWRIPGTGEPGGLPSSEQSTRMALLLRRCDCWFIVCCCVTEAQWENHLLEQHFYITRYYIICTVHQISPVKKCVSTLLIPTSSGLTRNLCSGTEMCCVKKHRL